jgi:hypothetical protein
MESCGYGPRAEATEPQVTVLVLDNDRLYVGGRFKVINGRERSGLAALDVATGAATNWTPNVGEVMALALAGDTAYAAGFFGEVGAGEGWRVERQSLAAFDARTGRVLPWRADAVSDPDPGLVDAIALVGDRLYVGGDFAELAGEPCSNIGVVSATSGAPIPWQPRPSAGDYSLLAAGDHVLVGSHFAIERRGSRPQAARTQGFMPSFGTTTGSLPSRYADPEPRLRAGATRECAAGRITRIAGAVCMNERPELPLGVGVTSCMSIFPTCGTRSRSRAVARCPSRTRSRRLAAR